MREGITAATVAGIFQNHIGIQPMPSQKEVQSFADELNLPWVTGYKHGLWRFMLAIRVVLDDGPLVIEAERRQRLGGARKRADAYSRLVEGAQALLDAGVSIPQIGDTPPKTKQALSVANAYHRDWKMVFSLVSEALTSAGWVSISNSEISPEVNITCDLLRQLGIPSSPAALARMLRRAAQARRLPKDK